MSILLGEEFGLASNLLVLLCKFFINLNKYFIVYWKENLQGRVPISQLFMVCILLIIGKLFGKV